MRLMMTAADEARMSPPTTPSKCSPNFPKLNQQTFCFLFQRRSAGETVKAAARAMIIIIAGARMLLLMMMLLLLLLEDNEPDALAVPFALERIFKCARS